VFGAQIFHVGKNGNKITKWIRVFAENKKAILQSINQVFVLGKKENTLG